MQSPFDMPPIVTFTDYPPNPGETLRQYDRRMMRVAALMEAEAIAKSEGPTMNKRDYAGNRDYFSKPLQGDGRGAHDYGRTGKIVEPRTIDLTWLGFLTCVAALAFLGAKFAGWI